MLIWSILANAQTTEYVKIKNLPTGKYVAIENKDGDMKVEFSDTRSETFELRSVFGAKERIFISKSSPDKCLAAIELEVPMIENLHTNLSEDNDFAAISKVTKKGRTRKIISVVLEQCDPEKPTQFQKFYEKVLGDSKKISYNGLCFSMDDQNRAVFEGCAAEKLGQQIEIIKQKKSSQKLPSKPEYHGEQIQSDILPRSSQVNSAGSFLAEPSNDNDYDFRIKCLTKHMDL